jgi:hypothetical protein
MSRPGLPTAGTPLFGLVRNVRAASRVLGRDLLVRWPILQSDDK